ncbi:MAG: gfo/Idh/MocA family oxidoreductase [Candidatus Latescibacteria bacterium]|nr:gfo/Idh/MocA family oxidoreductase [Candidatus Latescibacterota bacterium]
MARKLTAVLAGCGGMSRAWLGAAAEMNDVEVIGLVDIVAANAQRHAAEFAPDAATGTDLGAVLKAIRPDMVFDCTVPEAHTQVALTAFKHGCHVLGEKPMADSMANARRALKVAERAGKIYAVIQNRRYNAAIRRLRRVLARGAIGQITTVDCDFYIGAHFGGFRDRMEHVLLLDMAIHTFDAARLLSGADPVSVYCREWNPAGSWYDHDASAIALFEMTDGIVYTYRGSWCAEGRNTSWESNWRIVGTKGSATWDGGEEIVVERARNKTGFFRQQEEVAVPPLAKRDRIGGHAGIIREFVDCVGKGGTPETICTDNIKSLAMVFGAIDSAGKNRPVPVKW